MPYRAPGSPGHSRQQSLSGKPITYYRPTGSRRNPAPDRQRVPGVQRRAALRGVPDLLGEDAGAGKRHHDRADGGRRDDAGRARRLRHRDDGSRARRLRHLDRRESLSRSALRAELHAAPRLAVRQRRRAVRRRRDPDLRRPVSGDRAARDRRLHPRLHRPLRPERADRHLGIPLPARASICSRSIPAARSTRSSRAPRMPACRSTPRRPATARSG